MINKIINEIVNEKGSKKPREFQVQFFQIRLDCAWISRGFRVNFTRIIFTWEDAYF